MSFYSDISSDESDSSGRDTPWSKRRRTSSPAPSSTGTWEETGNPCNCPCCVQDRLHPPNQQVHSWDECRSSCFEDDTDAESVTTTSSLEATMQQMEDQVVRATTPEIEEFELNLPLPPRKRATPTPSPPPPPRISSVTPSPRSPTRQQQLKAALQVRPEPVRLARRAQTPSKILVSFGPKVVIQQLISSTSSRPQYLNTHQQLGPWQLPMRNTYPRTEFRYLSREQRAACEDKPIQLLTGMGNAQVVRANRSKGTYDVCQGELIDVCVNLPLEQGDVLMFTLLLADDATTHLTPQLCTSNNNPDHPDHEHAFMMHKGMFMLHQTKDHFIMDLGNTSDSREYRHWALALGSKDNVFRLSFSCTSHMSTPKTNGNYLLVIQAYMRGQVVTTATPIRVVPAFILASNLDAETRCSLQTPLQLVSTRTPRTWGDYRQELITGISLNVTEELTKMSTSALKTVQAKAQFHDLIKSNPIFDLINPKYLTLGTNEDDDFASCQ